MTANPRVLDSRGMTIAQNMNIDLNGEELVEQSSAEMPQRYVFAVLWC
jgi:hypothetical protein